MGAEICVCLVMVQEVWFRGCGSGAKKDSLAAVFRPQEVILFAVKMGVWFAIFLAKWVVSFAIKMVVRLPDREKTELGYGALNDAIRKLYYRHSQPSALLVIIQMVSEAERIRYVEQLIRRNMLGENLNFIPDSRARSMENRWSDLSELIQWSEQERSREEEKEVCFSID
nr:ribosome-inactivating protein [Tanacetum cinerariifolium]